MNTCIFLGRLAREMETKSTSSGKVYARVPLAVDRPYNQGEEKKADFPTLVAWGKTAENMAKYLKKGSQVCVTCHYMQNKFVKDTGETVYTHEFIVDRFEMCGSKPKEDGAQVNQQARPVPPAPQANYAQPVAPAPQAQPAFEEYEADLGLGAFADSFDEGSF